MGSPSIRAIRLRKVEYGVDLFNVVRKPTTRFFIVSNQILCWSRIHRLCVFAKGQSMKITVSVEACVHVQNYVSHGLLTEKTM
jgi:hypothetical protein